ncbi:metalloregulator ArsR/SmtB family transcription factor [Allohahella marinimesophila]|uniref:metalloregulator ArsR/SmtB family transcription factor n=1 Tax=Allohahella marinimesophila TaxID=1054972 RepID=UPI0031DD9D2A
MHDIAGLSPPELFKCLADDTRIRIVLLVARELELCVCELTEALDAAQPKISRHLAQLRACGLLEDSRQGQWVYYRIHPYLPDWARQIIAITGQANQQWLLETSGRLECMGDRPMRATNCGAMS